MALTKVTYSMIEGACANVLDYGADPTGVADSTAAIQAAIDAITSTGGEVYIPTGTYKLTTALVVDTGVYTVGIGIRGEGRNTILSQTGANEDVIKWSTTQFLQNSYLCDIQLVSSLTSGHCINVVYGCTCCFFDNLEMVVLNPAKACVYGDWSVSGGGMFDTKFRGGTWYCNPSSTEAGFRIKTNNTIFNENVFENLRVYQANTLQFFVITADAGNSYWLYNNTWKNINFEICKGGGFYFSCANRYIIENCSFWDAQGAYTNNLIDFAAGAGYESIANTIINVGRNGDTLGASVNDIRIVTGQDTVLINCYTQTADGPRYDFTNKRVTVIGKLFGTLNNVANMLAVNAIDGIRFMNTVNAASLNYYDQGTWTATLTGSSTGPTTPVTATGTWQRIGDLVTVIVNFSNVTTTGATGNISVTGLPFAANSSYTSYGTVGQSGLGASVLLAEVAPSATQMTFKTAAGLTQATFGAGTGQFLSVNLTYRV